MVRAVRSGESVRVVAREFGVSVSTVALWVERARGKRLHRVDFSDRAPGCARAWNRVATAVEQRILELRRSLRENSILGEYGAKAIEMALQAENAAAVPSLATINRVLSRHGTQDAVRRQRRPAPPRGWYLPAVAAGDAELDCFDLIEELRIAQGPLFWVLTGTSLHGGLVDVWPFEQATAKGVFERLIERWQRGGLPTYAQFDNGPQFQGTHRYPDSIGRISRLCLALRVTPVFAPPREPGFQNAIESFNGLWQTKVWQRYRFHDLAQLEATSASYVAAHRARNAPRREQAPVRRAFPTRFKSDLNAPLDGTLIFLRRADDHARVRLLGRSFELPAQWAHRLARCEVDLSAHQIRFFALRRRDPASQPMLLQVPYHREHKPFHGEP
jgi:transposase-like protein